jgi:2-methylcitrate dehydratase PrpD
MEVTAEVTGPLAAFVAGCRWSDLPEAVRKEAKRSLVNVVATSFAGCNEPAIVKAIAGLRPFGAAGNASVIGRAERLDALGAAFVNAMSANVFDFDDTHPATIIHPTAPVAPALFAYAETYGLSGEDLLLGFALGAEALCRIGNAVSPGHYRRGWHITSTCGVFGAAVATGKVLKLDQQQLVWAIGNAAVQTGGLVETLGTMAKSISVGNAARNGMLSALLARDGFSGPARPLEGERGFLRIATDAPKLEAVCDGLGERWELLTNTYKPYPCGVVLNPVIEACLALAADERLAVAEIAGIEITGHPLLRERTDRPGVRSGREAQVSAQHAVAVSLARAKAGLPEFSDAAVADPALRALGSKVAFKDDDSYAVDAARVSIRLRTGATLEKFVEHAYGGPARPMADADLETKLRQLAEYGGVRRELAPLIDALWSLERAADVAAVMALARSDAASRP